MAGDCVQCAPLRQILTTCGTCGPQGCPPGEHAQPCSVGETLDPQSNCCVTRTCPPGEHLVPCASNEVVDAQTGCCRVSIGQNCPTGEHAQPCGQGEVIDPATECCRPALPPPGQCPSTEHAQPCFAERGEFVDPQTNCCMTGCLPGEVTQTASGSTVPGQCGPGYTLDPLSTCCKPSGLCPQPDVPAVQGVCPAGTIPDALHPGCCLTQTPKCPAGDVPLPCPTGYQVDQASPNCCKPEPVEACFVCPGGLPDLALALQGMPNDCYLASQMFLPGGAALPPPAP